MIYKRKEGFRYAFGESIEAGFVVLIDGKPVGVGESRLACHVLDISPHGLKMATNVNLSGYMDKMLQLEISFVIDKAEIRAIGEIVWCKKFGSGYHYGIVFYNQPGVESMIISELKARRRREALGPKTGK
ncbi:MAG: PilZ domain-containing protein [Lysinibacillus sp.]